MSFILDALKKSESERQRQSGPGVFQPRIASPRARFPVWAIALGLLLGVNLLVLLWVMTRPDPAPETGAAAPAAAAPAAATSAAPTAGSAPAAAAPAAAPVAAAGTRFNPPLIVDPTLGEDGGVSPGTAPAGPPSSPGAAFNPNDYVPAQPGPAAPTTNAAAANAAAQRDAAATAGVPSNYATREALVARGQNVPEVALSLHVYDADPARRFVFVNGQRGRDGETLSNGLRIEQILPEGAVLSWNGNRFFAPLQ
jgi:general secretion pathway protein B